MNETVKNIGLFVVVACLIAATGFIQSWNTALFILNMGLISAIMSLGVNLQWGFAGLFNVGVVGFGEVALAIRVVLTRREELAAQTELAQRQVVRLTTVPFLSSFAM